MARSTYREDHGYRRYVPELHYGGGFFGREIADSTVFDEVRILTHVDLHVIYRVNLLNAGQFVSEVPGWRIAGTPFVSPIRYDRNDPEVSIVRAAVRNGTPVVFESAETNPPRVMSRAELHSANWLLDLLHPFHDDDKDLFMERLTEHLEYSEPDPDRLPHFLFPGIIEGHNRRFYKRDDGADEPDVRSVNDLAGEGWTPNIPRGSHRLHYMDVLDGKAAVSVGRVRAMYHRRKDVDGDIRAIARAWHAYWSGLTSSEQGINTRQTLKRHVEHAIGRAWDAKPFGSDIRVFYQGDSGATTRDARDAEDWFLGNLEEWAHDRGFAAFALVLNEGQNRAVLDSQLGDYTFCLINADGSLNDRLANPNEGITQSQWDAWGGTDYNAALGTLISVEAGADQTAASRADVVLVASATVTNAMGTTTYSWEQESGETVTLLPDNTANTVFAAPRLEVGDDPAVLVFKVTATNNGESASDTVTVTVNPPAAPPPTE